MTRTTRLTSLLLLLALACASPSLEDRLATPDRSEADRARDAGRQPAAVVTFLGIEPGMTVMDLVAAGGYYTEVLSIAVGAEGTVYAQNPPIVLKFRDGANDKALTARLAGGRLANVERLDVEITSVPVAPGSLDAAITALNFHDIYNRGGEEAAVGFLEAVYALLAPGGVMGIIDHDGSEGQDNSELHRIERQLVLDTLAKTRFVLEAESELLRNPEDDHTQNVFGPGMRGNTDRFLLRLRKPAA